MEDLHEDLDALFDEDLAEMINFVNPLRHYNVRQREDHFQNWNDNEFYDRFRLSKPTVLMILEQINDQLQHRTQRNLDRAIQPIDQLLLTLRFCATGSFYITIGDFLNIHRSTAGKIIQRVITAICGLREQYIKFPRTDAEKQLTMTKFYTFARFPRVVGAIDCTHVKLQSPGGENPEIFRNRKGFFSLNVQAICDGNNKITDIVCRWPGSAHDAHIFNNSSIKMRLEQGEFGNGILLGDSGYPLKPYLMTPLNHPQNQVQNLYNESQIRTRNVIKRTFGIIKRRFPVLSIGMRCRLELSQKVIVACAVLHNIACEEDNLQFHGPDEEGINEEIYEEENDADAARDDLIDYFENLLNIGE